MRETKSSKRLGRGSALRRRERNKMLYFQVREKKWLERKKRRRGGWKEKGRTRKLRKWMLGFLTFNGFKKPKKLKKDSAKARTCKHIVITATSYH